MTTEFRICEESTSIGMRYSVGYFRSGESHSKFSNSYKTRKGAERVLVRVREEFGKVQ